MVLSRRDSTIVARHVVPGIIRKIARPSGTGASLHRYQALRACTCLAPAIWPEEARKLSPAQVCIRLVRLSAPQRALQFGHLKAGFHFVPEGQAIVARRFIAGLAIHRDLRPGGTLEVGSGLLRIRRAGYVQGANFHQPGHITRKRGTQSKDQRLPKSPPIALCYLCVLLCKFSWTTSVTHAPNSDPSGTQIMWSRTPAINRRIWLAKSSTSNRPVVLTKKPGSFVQLFDTTNG
jgi:hypothetical protein